jgi:DNA-directed RNA polymerase specialized sigma24 family protein
MLRIPASSPQPDRLAMSGEVSERVQVALAGLTAQERTAFVLRHRRMLVERVSWLHICLPKRAV